jgi:hypothetical protein
MTWPRYESYRQKAELHARREWRFHRAAADGEVGYPTACELDIERAEKIAQYEARLRQKYLRAAWQPWKRVEPDPAPP